MSVDVEFYPIFSSPFGWSNFGEQARELNKILVSDIQKEMKKPPVRNRSFNNLTWQSPLGLEKEYDSFELLCENIEKCVLYIMEKSGIDINQYLENRIYVRNLWANVIHKAGGYSKPHTHGKGNTLWSGVYYPEGNEKDLDYFNVNEHVFPGNHPEGGCLVLQDPGHLGKWVARAEHLTTGIYYGDEITIKPRQSLLIMFPAWMQHYVQPTTNDRFRYSISFSVDRLKVVE